MRFLPIACAILAVAACQKSSQPPQNEATTAPPGEVKGADRSDKGKAAPHVPFNDPNGETTNLKAFEGKPTLVNFWASWCAPCVKELPTLDRLARAEQGKLNVVAINQDSGPHASVEAFLNAHKIETLKSYQDAKMAVTGALGAEVLPTSVLFDANGKEVWRYVGDQDWTSAEAARLLVEGGAAKAS